MEKGNKEFDFRADLSFGLDKEKLIKDILTGDAKVEVKSENTVWEKSHNIVIELKCRNVDSGITSTTSQFWVHNLISKGKFMGGFIFSVELLRKYLKKLKKNEKLRTVYGGQDNSSLLVLIPIKDLWEIMMPEMENNNEPKI